MCRERRNPSLMKYWLLALTFFSPLFAETDGAPDVLEPISSLQPAPEVSEETTVLASFFKDSPPPKIADNGYTINYNTVSIIEYIRFASKICNVNFIFNEADLNFTVTVISEDPITPDNVMATLVQVLRIHGLQLIEQGNNLVIHKSDDVKQIATLYTEDDKGVTPPITTRIFRLQRARPDSVAVIIKSMISKTAILETSVDTRQIILTDVTANVEKVAMLIENLDAPENLIEIKSYETLHNKPEYLIEIATQLMDPIVRGSPFILVPNSLAKTIFIVSTPELTAKTLEILKGLDLEPKKSVLAERKLRTENIFVYKLEQSSGDDVLKGLSNIADNLEKSGVPETDLIETIDSAKWIRETNSIMIVGSKDSIDKIKEFIAALDVPSKEALAKTSFFVYKPVNRSAPEIFAAIREMAANLKGTSGSDSALITTIQSSKINEATHTITFSGEEKTFSRIKELLATIDTGKTKQSPKNNFFVYQIKSSSASQIESSLKSFAKKIDKSNVDNEDLPETIDGMKYIKETNSFLFTGSDQALKRLQEILPSFDTPTSNQFYIYKPKYQRGTQLVASLKDVTDNLKANALADPAMLNSLESMKWVKTTNSILFTGDPDSLKKIQDLIATIDVPSGPSKSGYYIYKLQNVSGEVIEEELDKLAKDFKSSGLTDAKILDVIENMRYVKETNSLLLTGDPTAIDEVKEMISRYDTPLQSNKSNYFMYKPQHATAANIEKSLRDIAKNLKSAELSDPPLLSAIATMKYSETTNTILFTGTPDALGKIQAMLKEIDVPPAKHAPIQHVGKTTYLLYKLKNASAPQITGSLKAITTDLKKSGNADKEFIAALTSMKYVRDTNSLMFTGSQEALTKVEALVERFDVTGANALAAAAAQERTASHFYVYKPQSLAGTELEKLLQDFAENLRQSGLSDPDLFQTISSMRWVEKTQSLLFTGSPKSLDQIKELLREFDVANNLPSGPLGGSGESSIQAIDNTSFLVYKLQFHKGDEIQGALRQIAKDLILSNAPVNQNLLNSINSIQWLEVTNSLLCSGDQETLTRLRELIKNLDIPLKQVFIEMLVIQTSLTNSLTFGLEWGAKYKYRDKFSGTMNNLIPQTNQSATGGTNGDQLQTALSPLTNINTPTPQIVPILGPGFDLGIIGEVIRHGGDTYLTLGSLLAALQTDAESTIVMTPKIITQDGRTSTIFQGQNIPFAGSFVSNSSVNATGGTIGTTNIEYRDIGLSLTITPVLGNSDIVTLDINLDQTSTGQLNAQSTQISFNNNGTPTGISGITTSKTTMQTSVHVPDNHFLVLSGMVQNSNNKLKTGIPCLGGLPFIGAAFSQDNTDINNTNVVIFLRPHIINSIDDITRITHEQELFFRDQAGTPFLEHNYNEAMELIKSVDDE